MARERSGHGIADVVIEGLTAAGDGLARHARAPLLVPFTIPGERVRVRIERGVSSGAIGHLLEVLRASPHRVVPRCRHFGPCGGCAWQHIAYPEQLRLKTALLDRLVRTAVPDAPPVRAVLHGTEIEHPWGYRQKVHFVFGSELRAGARTRRESGAGPLIMGHYARRSRRIVPVVECPVHDERGNALAFDLRDRYVRAGVRGAGGGPAPSARRPPHGVLKSLAVRAGLRTGERLATLVVTADTDRRLRTSTRALLESEHGPSGMHLNVHGGADPFIFGAETKRLAGTERLREEVAGTSFLISPTAFFQTNVRAAEILVQLVLDAIPSGGRVLDLYAGAGLFALPLARRGDRVVAVEENRTAVADCVAGLRLNRIPEDRCRVISRPVEAALPSQRTADAAILDPPREGCSRRVIDQLFGTLRPPLVMYVSCNPEALARDLSLISERGYRIETIQPVDMFPHTAHIETVVTLRRRRGNMH